MAFEKIMEWKGEQLFMFEVFVDRLDIVRRKRISLNESKLLINIKVIDLPPFEIDTSDFSNTTSTKEFIDKENCNPNQNSIVINSGKSCIFSKMPSSLVKIMTLLPMIIEVYKILANKYNSITQPKRTLLFTTKVPLPGCLCDQVNLALTNSMALSTPYTAKNVYNLYDLRGKQSAFISIVLRLSCVGNLIMTDFTLDKGKFIIQDSFMREKFFCNKVPVQSTTEENNLIKPIFGANAEKDGTVPRQLMVLAATSSKLPIMKDNPLDTYSLLKRPESPPRISMKETGFYKLTSAEKLNDRHYRNLIYRAYPDEPTCFCLPKFRSTNPMVCSSGCTGPCCMKLRNPKIVTQRVFPGRNNIPLMPTYCVSELHRRLLPVHDFKADCCNIMRLRGGGSVEDIYRSKAADNYYCNTDNLSSGKTATRMRRLLAGGEYDTSCACSTDNPGTVHTEYEHSLGHSSCRPRSKSLGGVQASCVCAGKQTQLSRKGTTVCTKAPCMGVDCLIRAFQEAQEFVDSIGKVPGLEGLGLMDPSESPFFRRNADKDYQEFSVERTKEQQATHSMTNRHCTAPCNTLLGKPPDPNESNSFIPYTSTTPLSLALPRHTGVVREGIPTLPAPGTVISSSRPRRKENIRDEGVRSHETMPVPVDMELGPCRESKCKARLKKPSDDVPPESKKSDDELFENNPKELQPQKMQVSHDQYKETQRFKHEGKIKGAKFKTMVGKGINGEKSRGKRKKETIIKDIGLEYKGSTKSVKIPVKSGWPGPDGDRLQTPVKVSPQVMRYIYTTGNYYPGTRYGHRDCLDVRLRIPSNMGWLWNTSDVIGTTVPGLGWKPGAINRATYNVLKEAKAISLENIDSRESSRKTQGMRSIRSRGKTTRNRQIGAGGRARQAGGGETTRQESTVSETRLKGGGKTIRQEGSGIRSQKEDFERQEGTLKSLRQEESRSKLASNPRGKKGKMMKSPSGVSMKKTPATRGGRDDEETELPPTLHIHRKDGVYYVTMYPIRKETSDEPRLEEPMKPLQFKIVKNKDEDSDSSSSTASDMEIEFSPPAAVNRYRKKPDVVHVSTQVKQQEILDAFATADGKKTTKKDKKDAKEDTKKDAKKDTKNDAKEDRKKDAKKDTKNVKKK